MDDLQHILNAVNDSFTTGKEFMRLDLIKTLKISIAGFESDSEYTKGYEDAYNEIIKHLEEDYL